GGRWVATKKTRPAGSHRQDRIVSARLAGAVVDRCRVRHLDAGRENRETAGASGLCHGGVGGNGDSVVGNSTTTCESEKAICARLERRPSVGSIRAAGIDQTTGRNRKKARSGWKGWRRDLAYLTGFVFGEPECAVRTRDDAVGTAIAGGDEVLGDAAGRSDADDLAGVEESGPEVSVGAGGDLVIARGLGQRELM